MTAEEDLKMLRERAENFRRIASTVTDARALKALNDLAQEFEDLAARVEATLRAGR